MSLRPIAFLFFVSFGAAGLCAGEAPAAEVLRLETAVDQALANNLGLIAARYSPANALEDVLIEQAAFDPELFGSTARSESLSAASSSSLDSASIPESQSRRSRVGVDKRFSTGANVTVDTGIRRSSSNNNAARNPDYSTDVGLSLRQPLWKDAWQKVNLAPLARARAASDQSVFELRTEILDVISNTEIAYWNLAYTQAELALIASSLELAENLLEENREREKLGLVTPLEVLQAETELVNQQEDVIQAERAIEDAEDVLRALMGTVSFLDDLDGDIAVLPMPSELSSLRSMDVIVRDTILSDADAQAQERALEVQRINKILAEDETRPDLDLTADVNYTGRDSDGETAYRDAYNAKGYDWNVGLELRFPLGFREARAGVRKADRNVARETVRLYEIKQQKALAARNAWRAVHAGQKRIEVTRQALRLNEETFEQARARYGSGLVAYRQVLEAQRDFDRARSNYLSAIIDTLRATVRLSRVDGTILARNGFTWETIDALAEAPDLEAHPQGDSILIPDT